MEFIPKEFLAAWQEHDREITIRKTKWGCIFGIIMVPVFGVLDRYVYPEQAHFFFLLRLLCSALMAALLFVLGTHFGKKYYHFQGLVLLFLPSATIAWMIYAEEGAASSYYAGLILVLMVLAVVLDWTFWQSVVSVLIVLALYVAACVFSHGSYETSGGKFNGTMFVNNLFFLVSSSIAIIAGTYFHSRVRMREFVSRCELDKSSKALAASLKQLKENEMQLVQSEKLASLGRMSAGIIHEINNPLNFAKTGLFTLRKKGKNLPQEQQPEYAEILTDVEQGLNRVQTIVSDLRMFTHPDTENLDSVTPEEVVQPALRFLNNEWRDAVHVEQKYAPNQILWANKNKLIHMMVNIIQNSLDAIKAKTFTNGEKPAIWIEGRVEGDRNLLIVRDNGHGIEARHLDKIFDPFFTTKDVGEGMGLGLSICYSIMQECSGKISVNTEPGKFCEFTLEFPVKTQQAGSRT
jgi:two-component system sensor histidine kinase PhcS